MNEPLLLTGATGFIGTRAYPALRAAGWDVLCASRNAEEAARHAPDKRWVEFDVERPETVASAFRGVRAVVYLIHSMGQAGDFEAKERQAAEAVRQAAENEGVKRVVYLGGVAPHGEPSKHLRSRLATGATLRASSVATIELRASMIIGAGSLSFRMVRDLSARLPFMILPSWLQNRSQPVAIDDVVRALVRATELPLDVQGAFDLPGPETLTGEQILQRIAKLLGIRPYTMRVPVLSPKLSSYWLKLITGADFSVAQELVEGLKSDLLAEGDVFWRHLPDHTLTPFDVAVRQALTESDAELSLGTRFIEALLQRASRRASSVAAEPT